VPEHSRERILEYAYTDNLCDRPLGLRFEALARWRGRGNASGQNLMGGHAIRILASHVKQASEDDIAHTIAHELAHTEQYAEGKSFDSAEEWELDVEARLLAWGFRLGGAFTDAEKKELLGTLEDISNLAKALIEEVQSGAMPSGNSAYATARNAANAEKYVMQALDAWKAIGQHPHRIKHRG
jgi:hypothetical protein